MSRRLAVWLVLVIAFVALVASASMSGGGDAGSLTTPLTRNGVSYSGTVVQRGDGDERVAVVPIYGTLLDGDTPASGGSTGGDDVVRMLEAITEDEDAWDGVILELDTPGGSVFATEEITAALEQLEEETDLPILAWMRGTAASAGYYVSAPTDRIVAAPSTFTGSIGVILEYYVVDELADEIGVEAVTIKSGKLKDIGNPLRQETPEERALFQTIIDESYDEFVRTVAEGRDLDEARVRELADGRIYTGRQAKENGLVDVLGLRREAFDEMAKLIEDGDDDDAEGDDLDVVRFSRTYGFLESLTATSGSTLDTLATAKAVGEAISGDGEALGQLASGGPSRRLGDGFARLEYRAAFG